MRLRRLSTAGLALAAAALVTPAAAHVDVSGPGFAGKSQILTFSVGHGCAGADTFRLELTIPEAVTSLRALTGSFGEAQLTRDDTGRVVSVAWEKDSVRDGDDHYYQFGLRISVPNAPFTRLYFPALQSCRTPEGEVTTVAWAATPEEIAAAPEPKPEPAPDLLILPPRVAGWNQLTVPVAVSDLSVFADAQIVWAGDAAWSANPHTLALIRAEADVTELTSIPAGAEIWVKY